MFRLNKRGGLTTDREALHASPGYKRQIEALAKLRKRGDGMSAMTLPSDAWIDGLASVLRECQEHESAQQLEELKGVLPAVAAHAQMVESLKDPEHVHAMMLRGAIAVPTIRSMVHLRGEVPNGEDVQLARIAELQERHAQMVEKVREVIESLRMYRRDGLHELADKLAAAIDAAIDDPASKT